nr:hypothetical protein [Tanacetum cinerariifolium]
MYVPPPSITIVRPWFATIGYRREIEAKETLKKNCLPPRWRVLMAQIMQCLGGKIGGIRGDTCITTFRNALWAQYLPHSSMYVPPPSITIVIPWFATIGYRREIGAKETLKKNCLPPRWRLLMAQIMQCLGGKIGANKESRADDIPLKVKLEDLSDILKDTRSAFSTPDSLPDEPIIISDESEEEEEVARDKDTEATSHDVPKDTSVPPPPSLKSAQIQELMAQVYLLQSQKEELKQAKAKASHNFASFLTTEVKELPSKITGLSGEIKELKKHVRDMKIELLGDLKEILTKLETFTFTISSLSSQVAELKNIHWEFPAEFATMVENALRATSTNVPSAGKATASPAEGEKNTKDADINMKDELVDI